MLHQKSMYSNFCQNNSENIKNVLPKQIISYHCWSSIDWQTYQLNLGSGYIVKLAYHESKIHIKKKLKIHIKLVHISMFMFFLTWYLDEFTS